MRAQDHYRLAWIAAIRLSKSVNGRVKPEEFVGELYIMMAEDSLRTYDPSKGAVSTHVLSSLRFLGRKLLKRDTPTLALLEHDAPTQATRDRAEDAHVLMRHLAGSPKDHDVALLSARGLNSREVATALGLSSQCITKRRRTLGFQYRHVVAD